MKIAKAYVVVAVLLCGVLLIAGSTLAADEAPWHVIAGGGGVSTVGGTTLGGTIGQAIAGRAPPDTYELCSGFWCGAFQPVSASFTPVPGSGVAPLEVTFTNTSTGDYTTSAWDFGDGESSMETSPTHTYTEPGTYTVRLNVTGPGGSDTDTVDVVVEAPGNELYLPLVRRD